MSVSKKLGFFGVIVDPQSYLNIVYLLVAFPLGTFYFVFLITGLSLVTCPPKIDKNIKKLRNPKHIISDSLLGKSLIFSSFSSFCAFYIR